MYDKTIRMVNGRFVALLQDDDDFKDLSWVDDAVFILRNILSWPFWEDEIALILL